MADDSKPETRSGSVPLMGVLTVCSGLGLLLALKHFSESFRGMPRGGQFTLFAVGVVLVYWGLKQVVITMFPRIERDDGTPRQRYRVSLPREGLVFLGIMAVMFVGSLLGRSNMLMLVFVMMAGPWVLNGWIAFMLTKRNRVIRNAPRSAMAGQVVSVELTLENDKFLLSSWVMAARDRISGVGGNFEASVLFARVPPRSRRTAYYQIRLIRRGRYRLGPIELSTRFPLGLVERGLLFNAPGELLIHPRVGRLATRWKRDNLLAAELVQQQAARKGAFDDEFHGIREYRRGDDPRSIHWRTSARMSELMVREYHQSRDEHLVVLLDLWQPAQPKPEHRDRVELAVSLAATIGFEHLRQGRDAGLKLVVNGKTFNTWESQVGSGAVESMLDLLAVVQAGSHEGIGPLLDEAVAARITTSRVLLLTTRGEQARLAEQFEALGQGDDTAADALRDVALVGVDQSILESVLYLEDGEGA